MLTLAGEISANCDIEMITIFIFDEERYKKKFKLKNDHNCISTIMEGSVEGEGTIVDSIVDSRGVRPRCCSCCWCRHGDKITIQSNHCVQLTGRLSSAPENLMVSSCLLTWSPSATNKNVKKN